MYGGIVILFNFEEWVDWDGHGRAARHSSNSIYYLLGAVLSALHVLTHFIIILIVNKVIIIFTSELKKLRHKFVK